MEKKTIVLVCSAGMSTSALLVKMEEAARVKGIDVNILAISASELVDYFEENTADVILLGPQIRFLMEQFEEVLSGRNIPMAVINMSDYGLMNGNNVLDKALELIEG